jgi:O-methyltransferase involved in polyketide biosynthesis
MNRTYLTQLELNSALERGVRQLVFIGGKREKSEKIVDCSEGLEVFAVNEGEPNATAVTFVPTCFESEELAVALSRSTFDKLKASLFIWFGDASYRTMEAALCTLSFIASLPKGSGVVFDYTAEHRSAGSVAGTALDALASRVSCASGLVKYLIQPQAVAAMLRGLGFQHMTDQLEEEVLPLQSHIVTALV